jgi:CO/xanthine dehydrogenase Mo-binding subunit
MLELRKDIFADERDDNLREIGKPTQRQDMLGHVTATSTFFNDHKLQGMLHLKVLRSPHSHARIRRIDASEAERHPGVRRIIRGADVPRNLNTLLSLINFGKDDEPTLAVDKVRYKGEPIVAVVADSHRAAFEALAKIRVDYDPLPTVFDVEEAMKPGAPVVNETYPHDSEPQTTGNHGLSKRAEKGAIKKLLSSSRFLLPVHDRPAKIEGGAVVARLQDQVPGPLVQSVARRNWFPM